MKNKPTALNLSIVILILFTFSHTILLAQNGVAHPIVGTWAFDYGSSLEKMETSIKTRLDSIPLQKLNLEKVYMGRKIAFSADGNYVQLLADGRRSIGTWGINNDNVILITDPKGNGHPQKIIVLTNNYLILKPILNGQTRSLFPEWHFQKIKN